MNKVTPVCGRKKFTMAMIFTVKCKYCGRVHTGKTVPSLCESCNAALPEPECLTESVEYDDIVQAAKEGAEQALRNADKHSKPASTPTVKKTEHKKSRAEMELDTMLGKVRRIYADLTAKTAVALSNAVERTVILPRFFKKSYLDKNYQELVKKATGLYMSETHYFSELRSEFEEAQKELKKYIKAPNVCREAKQEAIEDSKELSANVKGWFDNEEVVRSKVRNEIRKYYPDTKPKIWDLSTTVLSLILISIMFAGAWFFETSEGKSYDYTKPVSETNIECTITKIDSKLDKYALYLEDDKGVTKTLYFADKSKIAATRGVYNVGDKVNVILKQYNSKDGTKAKMKYYIDNCEFVKSEDDTYSSEDENTTEKQIVMDDYIPPMYSLYE